MIHITSLSLLLFAEVIADSFAAGVLKCSPGLRVHQLSLGRMDNHQYIVDNGKVAIGVDAAWDVPRMKRYVESLGLRLIGGLYTHGHFDHVGGEVPAMGTGKVQGAPELQKISPEEGSLPLWIGKEDIPAASLQTGLAAKEFKPLKDGDKLDVLGPQIEILTIESPGHSKGGVAFMIRSSEKSENCPDGVLLTGDTIFIQSVGRTDLPGGSQNTMLKTLSRLSRLPDGAIVLSGHSYDAPPKRATMEHVRRVNSAMQQGIQKYPLANLKPLPQLLPLKSSSEEL